MNGKSLLRRCIGLLDDPGTNLIRRGQTIWKEVVGLPVSCVEEESNGIPLTVEKRIVERCPVLEVDLKSVAGASLVGLGNAIDAVLELRCCLREAAGSRDAGNHGERPAG